MINYSARQLALFDWVSSLVLNTEKRLPVFRAWLHQGFQVTEGHEGYILSLAWGQEQRTKNQAMFIDLRSVQISYSCSKENSPFGL